MTRLLPFDIQVGFASLSVVASFSWAAGISKAAGRTDALPARAVRSGRWIAVGLLVGAGVFVAGSVGTVVTGVSWLWALGGLPGVLVAFLFAVWTLLAGRGLHEPASD